jgi:threonine dehydratase
MMNKNPISRQPKESKTVFLSPFDYLRHILLANVYEVAKETELTSMSNLSHQYGQSIFLKREDQQPIQSFKIRGAYQKLWHLLKHSSVPIHEVVSASAGNHAQGLALAAQHLGLKASIFMPITTPEIKINNVKRLGASVHLIGTSFDCAQKHSLIYANQNQLPIIPPFDDVQVIIGQGTIAKELLQQLPDMDRIFIPVGGGGLLAGMAVYIKQVKPSIQIIAVESEDSACLQLALSKQTPTNLSSVGLFADGVAVKRIGAHCFPLIRDHCDDLITVNSDEICSAIKDIFEQTRVIAEPAGALSLAGLKKYHLKNQIKEKKTLCVKKQVAILSGANMSFHNLRYVSERCELGEKKEAVLAVTIPEKKGSFNDFCQRLDGRMITEFNYRYSSQSQKQAHIFVGIRLGSNPNERKHLIASLQEKQIEKGSNYKVLDLTDNELAKLHIRYMVGGGEVQKNERVFCFQFPEYPGALKHFLTTLGMRWNISLFHYRNHGAAFGQVLAGFTLPEKEEEAFFSHLKQLNYTWKEETHNDAYQTFLSSI